VAFLSGVPAQETALARGVPLVGALLEDQLRPHLRRSLGAQPENLAYSDLGLGLHTDNPYRGSGAGFQALHALIPASEGGESPVRRRPGAG